MAKRKISRDILIDIGAAYNIDDPSNALGAFSGLFQGIAGARILNNLCKYCNRAMTKAANTYIKNTILKNIFRKNKNIAWKAAGNEEYRGALGIPKRYSYTKFEAWLTAALVIEVRACIGENKRSDSVLAISVSGLKARDQGAAGRKSIELGIQERAREIEGIKISLDEIVEKAYKITSFKAGDPGMFKNIDGKRVQIRPRKTIYRRNWLIEADTGEPTISGFSVYPEKGSPQETFRNSRSGSHIMVEGGSYDPNEWRPDPSEKHAIRSTFIKGVPGMLQRIKLAAVRCLKSRKKRIQSEIQKDVDSQSPITVKTDKKLDKKESVAANVEKAAVNQPTDPPPLEKIVSKAIREVFGAQKIKEDPGTRVEAQGASLGLIKAVKRIKSEQTSGYEGLSEQQIVDKLIEKLYPTAKVTGSLQGR